MKKEIASEHIRIFPSSKEWLDKQKGTPAENVEELISEREKECSNRGTAPWR
jgi:hypothetical protein